MSKLMSKVTDYKNIHLAYLRVKNNFMNIELKTKQEKEAFEKSIPKIYENIKDILEEKTAFEFSPLEQLEKPKRKDENGMWETRPIARCSFFESVIMQSLLNILSEKIRHLLPCDNYGYNLSSEYSSYLYQDWKKGYSKFVDAEIEATSNEKFNFVVEADIENFYPSINKEELINQLILYLGDIDDDDTLTFIHWIEKILDITVKDAEGNISLHKGLPQGPLHSPVLALFFIRDALNEIKYQLKRTLVFGYVDDFRIYCETESEAKQSLELLKKNLEIIGLKLSVKKSSYNEITNSKKQEVKIMGKASNLNRAIKDEVILTANGKEEIQLRLKKLLDEIDPEKDDKGRFRERLEKFVDFRVFKLLDSTEEWDAKLDEVFDISNLRSNFTALWHVLYLGASTSVQQLKFFNMVKEILNNKEINGLSYVKYICLQYMFKFSPIKIGLKEDDISNILNNNFIGVGELFLKGCLSNIHLDWIELISNYIRQNSIILVKNDDIELKTLLMYFKLIDNDSALFDITNYDNRLIHNENRLEFKSTTYNLEDDFLENEKIKSFIYKKFKNKNERWIEEIPKNIYMLNDMVKGLTENGIKNLIQQLFKWIDFQIKSNDKRIPFSVVHPEYIWINPNTMEIYLFGNPAFKQDIFYDITPIKMWKESFITLFNQLFDITIDTRNKDISKYIGLQSWQFRIVNYLLNGKFTLSSFVEFVLEVLKKQEQFEIINSVDANQLKLVHLVRHYVPELELQDKFIQVIHFVENSWKNGAKECNFYTLHNHEHGTYLVWKLHEIFEKSGFSIYLNSKEAFRLFTACFLHDIGMLSSPTKQRLFNKNEKDVQYLMTEISSVVEVASSISNEKNILELPYIYEIYSQVEQFRESIVRNEHPFVSERELVGDYPKLSLSVAERRDIGVISAAHGEIKSNVNYISEVLHDGKHPIRLKLLSLLLRLADLCDVTKERVKKEILERNYDRMGKVSVSHWIKHLSVENLIIESIEADNILKPVVININIEHNYLPSGNVDKDKLKKKCGLKCKIIEKDEDVDGKEHSLFRTGKTIIPENNSEFKYFDEDNCGITCAFINDAYKWFYAELIYLNMYFKQKNINVRFDLNIIRASNIKNDFNYVNNRNIKRSAQEFFVNYYQ
jgi:Reverse transcriptase (RNA-dependent DNA polymerase)